MAAARGPQAGPIIFTYKGLETIVKNIAAAQKRLEHVDMSGPVRGAGKVWQQNFKTEGWLAGNGWKPLSEYTQRVRASRGYGPEHPILEQSGGLRRAAADYPAGMKAGQKSMNRTTSSGGARTTVTVRTADNRATLQISGEKVKNQTGGANLIPGGGGVYIKNLPARRFWFVSPEVRSQMLVELLDSLKDLWVRRTP